MVIDAHLHCTGTETRGDVLRALDDAGIDIGVLLAPFLSEGYSLADAGSLRRANDHLARLVRGAEDRLVGFAVVNPTHGSAPDDLRRAVDAGLRGAKMVPSGWYPYDPAVQPTFAEAARLRLPLLFHSGIFIDGRSGRHCRPVYFEALRDHPGARVALAHLAWPWTDEAIAVGLIDRIHGVPDAQAAFRFDLSFGPPPPYRLEVLRRALEVLGPGLLQFGSDCFLPCSGAHIAERRGWLVDLLDVLQLDAAARDRIFHGTAADWLGLAEKGAAPMGRAVADAAPVAGPDAVLPAGSDAAPAAGFDAAPAAGQSAVPAAGQNAPTAAAGAAAPAGRAQPGPPPRSDLPPHKGHPVPRRLFGGRGWAPMCC